MQAARGSRQLRAQCALRVLQPLRQRTDLFERLSHLLPRSREALLLHLSLRRRLLVTSLIASDNALKDRAFKILVQPCRHFAKPGLFHALGHAV